MEEADGDIYARANALCFIEDAFRCICFFEVARCTHRAHVCSSVTDWEFMIETSVELRKRGTINKYPDFIPHYVDLYQKRCEAKNCAVMPWVKSKLEAHIAFYEEVEQCICVRYDVQVGYGVFWKGLYDARRNYEFVFREPAPHNIFPMNFFNEHPDFGLQHPVTCRFWDVEGSETHGELIMGLIALFNSVCPECETIEISRSAAETPEFYESGYIRFRIMEPSLISSQTELAFPYRVDWFKRAEFPCLGCQKEPSSIVWSFSDCALDPQEMLISVIRTSALNPQKRNSVLFQCIEWLVFHLDKNLESTPNDYTDLFVFLSALVSFILRCFPSDDYPELPNLIAGTLLHRLGKNQHLTESYEADLAQSHSEFLMKTLFPRKTSIGFEFQDLFSLFVSNSSMACNSFRKHQESTSINDLQLHSSNLDSRDRFHENVEVVFLWKLLNFQEKDSLMKDFMEYIMIRSFKIVFGFETETDPIRIVTMMFALISFTSIRPSYTEPYLFQDFQGILTSKIETVQSFIGCGIESSALFPKHSLDLSPVLLSLSNTFVLGRVFSEFALLNFGGVIQFLLSKLPPNPVQQRLSVHFKQAFCRTSNVSSEYEEYLAQFMNDDYFFDSKDSNEERLSNFFYWCLSESSINSRWIKRLSSFPDIQTEFIFGPYHKDPLNLWTVLVYLCCIENDVSIRIGSDVFYLDEFTETLVVTKLRDILSAQELEMEDVYFLTHVVYVLTDYCTLKITSQCFQECRMLFSSVIDRLLKLMKCKIQPCFVEGLCEIYRNIREPQLKHLV